VKWVYEKLKWGEYERHYGTNENTVRNAGNEGSDTDHFF